MCQAHKVFRNIIMLPLTFLKPQASSLPIDEVKPL